MKQLLYISLSVFFIACAGGKALDRSIRPTPGPAPTINLGNFEKFDLDNGLKVIVVENHKQPRVSYQLSIDRNPVLEGDKAGAVSMMGTLLKSGTSSRSKAEIDEAVDFLGASIRTSPTSVSGSSLKKHESEMLDLMSDILMHPSFPESELEKLRKQTISGLASAKNDPNQMSSNIRSIMRYGKDHPYGEISTEKTIENISHDDVVGYYEDYFSPTIASLVIVGDITPSQARENANKYFGNWKSSSAGTMEYDMPREPVSNRVVFVPLTDAVQSVISVTYPVDLMPGSDKGIAASVMNSILGGGVFSGRLMQNLREDKAFTYGARSSLSPDRMVGSFSAGCSVRNEVTDSAVVEILFEMRRLTQDLVPDSTLQFVKNSMNGSFARSLENPQTIARFARNIDRYNLPSDYYTTYLEKLSAVTAQDVLEAAKKYIRPDNCYITVVGNKDQVLEGLVSFASSGEVEVYDMYGQDWKEVRPVPEGVNLGVVFDNYMVALGGADKIAKVSSYEQECTMTVMGMSLDMTMQMKSNSKYKMEIMMGGAALVTKAFNGTTGYSSQMGVKETMSDADIEGMRVQADLLSELRYEEYGVVATLTGVDDVEGEDAYMVELLFPSGNTQVGYYSVATGLKIKVISMEMSESGPVTSTTTIHSYRDVDGVKFANNFSVSSDGQESQVVVHDIKVNEAIADKEFD